MKDSRFSDGIVYDGRHGRAVVAFMTNVFASSNGHVTKWSIGNMICANGTLGYTADGKTHVVRDPCHHKALLGHIFCESCRVAALGRHKVFVVIHHTDESANRGGLLHHTRTLEMVSHRVESTRKSVAVQYRHQLLPFRHSLALILWLAFGE